MIGRRARGEETKGVAKWRVTGMGRITARRKVIRLTVGEGSVSREDLLAVEEPLEIRVGGRSLVP